MYIYFSKSSKNDITMNRLRVWIPLSIFLFLAYFSASAQCYCIENPSSINISTTTPSCTAGNDGSATANVTGNNPPFTYRWSNGQTGQIAVGLSVGTYTVTVTDSRGCTRSTSAIVPSNASFNLSITKVDATCGAANGSATVNINGGNTSPFTYRWNTGSINQTMSNVSGNLTVTVTDVIGCSAVASTYINSSGSLSVNVESTNIGCGFTITAMPISGTSPIAYKWNTGHIQQIINNLSSGTYKVTITDAQGCTATSSTNLIANVDTTTCRYKDSLQLINLYNATGGPNWTNQWNFNQPITTWYGIQTNTEGCVTFIDLDGNADFNYSGSPGAGGNNLTGQLPILTFSELLDMYLDNNHLSGTLPALNLPKINNLGIAHNPLIKGTIPTSWNFPNLEYLGLCCNGLDGVLPTLNFPKLIGIYLQDNQLHGELPVLNLPLLNELDFGRNNFSNCFPAAYRTLCPIRSHNFFNNPLLPNNGNFDEFCTNNSGICNNTTSCRYQDSLILANYFFPAMNGPNWRVQNFGGVKSPWVLSEPMENWLGVHFDNFDCVAQISLANNNLSGALPTELMQLTNLNYLGLSNNQISGSIPTDIGNLTKLTALDLSYNQLTGTLPSSLGNLRELILCYFGVNSNLTGDIPPSLGNLTKVEDLFLNECDFTGKIPSELGNMTNLKKMLLSSNRLSDTLPTNLGNLQNLKTMGLDDITN